MRGLILASLILAVASDDYDPSKWNPYNLTDCRNETAEAGPQIGTDGKLVIQSWHIHYTTNTSDQPRFYYAFIERFAEHFPPKDSVPQGDLCPFGPNFGSYEYEYMCSLETAPEEGWAARRALAFEKEHGAAADARFSPLLRSERQEGGTEAGLSSDKTPVVGDNPWGNLPQRAFFVPLAVVDEAWEWSQENKGFVDVGLHPNTGCMHDDHGLRIAWSLGEGHSEVPTIETLAFPCNDPATGCNDNDFTGEPSCGCKTPLPSDAPQDSCANCATSYEPSW